MTNTTEDFYNEEQSYFYCLTLELIHKYHQFLSIYLLQYYCKNLTTYHNEFSGANGQSLCNSCRSSGYSRSTSNMYPSKLFSLIKFTSSF